MAIRELATQVAAGRFRNLRIARRLGWFQLASGPVYLVFGVVAVIEGQAGLLVVGGLAILNGGLFTLSGLYSVRTSARIRLNAERALRRSRVG